jgi:beta-glucosidase
MTGTSFTPTISRTDFPDGFLFGTATAAYQIEGAVKEGGRGPSVWDTFVTRPGVIANGDRGEIACDHYHRWEDDLDLMAEMGADAYRFSISWPRVQPDGRGRLNPAGVDFYQRVVEGLADRGITAMATLFHWDLPQALEDGGGWLTRDTSKWFAEYAAAMADQLGERVGVWITLNEPVVHMAFGYGYGIHAPGRALGLECLPAGHHQLYGHGLAVEALRANGARTVGITHNLAPVWPATDRDEDLTAADLYDTLHNRLFLDPVLLGTMPERVGDLIADTDHIRDGDLATIAAPIDILGVNYYNPVRVGAPGADASLPFELLEIEGRQRTHFGWPIVPEGLTELLVGLRDRYGERLPRIQITENGCSQDDRVVGGVVDDPGRIRYLEGHLAALLEAIGAGVVVDGYYCWTLLDNFEWAEGFTQRFGLVHVDFDTQARTPKSSYHWFQSVLGR